MINIAIVSLTRVLTAITASSTKKLPTLAAATMPQLLKASPAIEPPKIPAPKTKRATPKLAPLEIPRTKGPAKGLRKSVCMSKPAMAKPLPTIRAVKALGKR